MTLQPFLRCQQTVIQQHFLLTMGMLQRVQHVGSIREATALLLHILHVDKITFADSACSTGMRKLLSNLESDFALEALAPVEP